MEFEITDELKEKIEEIIKNNTDLKNKILSGDGDAIRQIGIEAQKRIYPEDIVKAYESNNIDYLYKQAKKLVTMKEMYLELCDAYAMMKASRKESNGLGRK